MKKKMDYNKINIVEEILYQLYCKNIQFAEKLANIHLFFHKKNYETRTNDYFIFDADKKSIYTQPHFSFYNEDKKRGEFWGYGYTMMVNSNKSAIYSKNGMFVVSFIEWVKNFIKELEKRKYEK